MIGLVYLIWKIWLIEKIFSLLLLYYTKKLIKFLHFYFAFTKLYVSSTYVYSINVNHFPAQIGLYARTNIFIISFLRSVNFMKMFLTQVNGLFSRIYEKEQFSIEDSARFLAQAAIGEGKIYIKGFNEMEAVTLEALEGAERLKGALRLTKLDDVSDTDRVILLSRFSNDAEALALAEKLEIKGVPFISICGDVKSDENDLSKLAEIHINTTLLKPMLPTESGERICFPTSMAALFIYHCIKLTFDEIIEEYK